LILLDTSALVRSLAGGRSALERMEALVDRGERLRISALVLYEWRRGPRLPEELAAQEALVPSEQVLEFDGDAALLAADLYRTLGRPRRRATDLAIAATALRHEATLWTFNPRDFSDVPGLRLLDG
jgi:tRNA(fMet)-specific endonuclease VapC